MKVLRITILAVEAYAAISMISPSYSSIDHHVSTLRGSLGKGYIGVAPADLFMQNRTKVSRHQELIFTVNASRNASSEAAVGMQR